MSGPEDRPANVGFGIPIPKPEPSGEFPLIPNLDMVVDDYVEANYAKEATEIFQEEQNEHPEIFARKKGEKKAHFGARKNIRAQVAFIQAAFAWREPSDIAPYLGITPSQVARKDFRGRRKNEPAEKFKKRLKGMFAIASILTRYVEEATDRRAAIAKVNGLISDVRLKTIMEAGKLNVATCITQETVRNWGISQDHQVQTARIGAHQEITDPDGYQAETAEGDEHQIGPLDNEFP